MGGPHIKLWISKFLTNKSSTKISPLILGALKIYEDNKKYDSYDVGWDQTDETFQLQNETDLKISWPAPWTQCGPSLSLRWLEKINVDRVAEINESLPTDCPRLSKTGHIKATKYEAGPAE